jgi:hypothetical protein
MITNSEVSSVDKAHHAVGIARTLSPAMRTALLRVIPSGGAVTMAALTQRGLVETNGVRYWHTEVGGLVNAVLAHGEDAVVIDAIRQEGGRCRAQLFARLASGTDR